MAVAINTLAQFTRITDVVGDQCELEPGGTKWQVLNPARNLIGFTPDAQYPAPPPVQGVSLDIPTMAQLRLTAVVNGEVRQLVGYNTAGDAGDPWGMCYRTTGRPALDNGGTEVFGPGLDDWWQATDTLNAYPRRFGARDGVDSTTQLQACVDACSNVIIDACDYRTSAAIVVPDNVTITGIGWQSKITQTAIGHNLLEIASENVTVSGLHLIGAGLVTDTFNATDHGIYSIGSLNLLVEKCFIEQMLGSGIDLRNTINMTIRNNTFFRNVWGINGTSEGDIKTWGADTTPDRLVVTGNRCYSNNSQGIYISPLAGTNQVIVSDNICVTLDPTTCIEGGTWAELAKGSVSRRHGIILGYGGSTAMQMICTGNILGNTLWTGIYKQGDTTGGVLIAHNYCFLNGDPGGTAALMGGIWVNCQGGNEVIRDNFIERNQWQGISLRGGGISESVTVDFVDSNPDTITRASGSWVTDGFRIGYHITITDSVLNDGDYYLTNVTATTLTLSGSDSITADTADVITIIAGSDSWSVCSGNRIKMEPEEGQRGIYVQIEPRKMLISNNTISRTGTPISNGIYLEPGAGQTAAAEIVIDSNQVTGFNQGIAVSNESGNLKRLAVTRNQVSNMLNSGIRFGGSVNTTVSATGNNISDAVNGIQVVATLTGRIEWDCQDNTMQNVTNGFDVSSPATTHSLIVGNTRFDTVTNEQISSNGSDIVRFGERIASGKYRFVGTAIPTVGSHVVGDEFVYSAPAAGAPTGALCITAGTPGIWRETGGIIQSSALGNSANSINTYDKYLGKQVWDTAGAQYVNAIGTTPTSAWRPQDGAADITPV